MSAYAEYLPVAGAAAVQRSNSGGVGGAVPDGSYVSHMDNHNINNGKSQSF